MQHSFPLLQRIKRQKHEFNWVFFYGALTDKGHHRQDRVENFKMYAIDGHTQENRTQVISNTAMHLVIDETM